MDDSEFYFQKIDGVLDREIADLTSIQKEHHTSWDNHILTLSTAAIGFSFSFLNATTPEFYCLFFIGVSSFVLSIVFAMANYIFADKGLKMAVAGYSKRRSRHNDTRHRYRQLQKQLTELGENGDKDIIQQAKTDCWNDIDILEKYKDSAKDIEELNTHNKRINFLNYAKTYAFLSGIVFITTFALINISGLGV